MTYEAYRVIFIVGAILCGVMIIASVLIFILMNIPRVISELSGKTARRAIANIRQKNEAGGEHAYKSATAKVNRIKVEDKLTQSGRIAQKKSHMGHPVETAKISTKKLIDDAAQPSANTTVLTEPQYTAVDNMTTVLGNETTVLSAQSENVNETAVLGENETTVLGAGETSVLGNGDTTVLGNGDTTVLGGGETNVLSTVAYAAQTPAQNSVFVIEKDITYIHSDEIISIGA